MTTNSTGDLLSLNINLGSVINVAKLFEGAYNRDYNCILKNTPPPLFGLAVVYKIGYMRNIYGMGDISTTARAALEYD